MALCTVLSEDVGRPPDAELLLTAGAQLAVGLSPEEFAAVDTSPLHGPTLAAIAERRGLPVPLAAGGSSAAGEAAGT